MFRFGKNLPVGRPVFITVFFANPFGQTIRTSYGRTIYPAEKSSHGNINVQISTLQSYSQPKFRFPGRRFFHDTPLQGNTPGKIEILSEKLERIILLRFHIFR